MIDTPWNDELTGKLCEWVKRVWGVEVKNVIVTHYHADNLGGLGYLHSRGVDSSSYSLTRELCSSRKLPIPRDAVGEREILRFDPLGIEFFFPGPGHTADSSCVYIPSRKLLFGGCSVKALSNATLGNTAEAELEKWPDSLEKLRKTFPEARIVVPGHGNAGNLSLIDHTLSLFSR